MKITKNSIPVFKYLEDYTKLNKEESVKYFTCKGDEQDEKNDSFASELIIKYLQNKNFTSIVELSSYLESCGVTSETFVSMLIKLYPHYPAGESLHEALMNYYEHKYKSDR